MVLYGIKPNQTKQSKDTLALINPQKLMTLNKETKPKPFNKLFLKQYTQL